MSLLLRLLVPLARSRCSSSPVLRPRVTASSATPAPTTPPPTTRTSSSSAPGPDIAASARTLASGLRTLGPWSIPPIVSGVAPQPPKEVVRHCPREGSVARRGGALAAVAARGWARYRGRTGSDAHPP